MKKIYSLLLAALMCTAGTNAWALTQGTDGYYQIGTAEDLVDFATGVNNKSIANTSNAKLTSDIDLSGINFTPIGLYADFGSKTQIRYQGTFDGQGHIIRNLNIDANFEYEAGLFSRTQNATIRNLGFENASITNTYKPTGYNGVRAGVLGGEILQSHVYNVFAVGNISITTGYQEGGLAGEAASGTTFHNCYTTMGKLSDSQGNNDHSLVGVSAADLASGKIAYTINQAAGETIYYQTLGTDPYPVLDSTHGTVYAQGDVRCDGLVLSDDVSYTNTVPTLPDHQYTDGFCTACGQLQLDFMTPNAQGNYEIGTVAQLKWFATYVNQENQSINAVLTADVEGFTGPMIGESDSKPYTGTFDGQFHKLNFQIGDIHQVGGLFRNLAGTVRNMYVGGTLTIAANVAGGVAGDLRGGTVENIVCTTTIKGGHDGDSAYGGIASRTMAGGTNYIKNCVFAGKIEASNATSAGGIIGWTWNNIAEISNCLAIGDITLRDYGGSNTIGRGRPVLSNNYYLNAKGGVQGTQTTQEALTSGELTYTLGNGWYQTLPTDTYPVPDPNHGTVQQMSAAGVGTYYGAQPVTFSEGINVYTGKVEGDVLKLTKQQNTIPAETAVLIEGAEGYYSITPATDADPITGTNSLVGSATAVTADGTQYALALSEGKPAFMKVQSGIQIPAGKAYLVNGTGVKGFAIGFGETGLNEVTTDNGQETTVIYDLQGRRVTKATKGIYIVNGKKVLR